jgi:hypothetical protein
VNKHVREKIVASQRNTDTEIKKVLIETVAYLSEGKTGSIPQSSILFTRQLETGSWTVPINDIKYNEKEIVLREPVTARLTFENDFFALELGIVGLTVHSNDPNKILIDFNKAFIELYITLVVNGEAYNDEALVTQNILLDIVFSRNW